MRRQKEVNLSVLRSRKQWLEIVPERNNAKDPAPLKIKEVWVEDRRYVVCLNEEEHRKDALFRTGCCNSRRSGHLAMKGQSDDPSFPKYPEEQSFFVDYNLLMISQLT